MGDKTEAYKKSDDTEQEAKDLSCRSSVPCQHPTGPGRWTMYVWLQAGLLRARVGSIRIVCELIQNASSQALCVLADLQVTLTCANVCCGQRNEVLTDQLSELRAVLRDH